MQQIADQTRVAQSERTASRVIDGRAVVVVIDEQKLHTLNPVGTFIWSLADGRTIDGIAAELANEFSISPGDALADTKRFVMQLRELGALDVRPAS